MKVIAECGVNWDDLKQAKVMINKSRWALCDYAKFQLYNNNVIRDHPLRAELKDRMLSKKDAQELFDYGKKIGQPVFFTPMFLDAIDWIVDIGAPMIKIRYADRYNTKLVNRAKETGTQVLMSADRDFKDLYLDSHAQTKFLYCVSRYPADPKDYVLTPIDFSARLFSGVSDHTSGFEVMRKALDCGAEFYEAHMMLSDTQPIEERWSKTFEGVGEFLASIR
jgi:sialic acid synthase SpsE